jgi:hypothetical protein
MIYDLRFVIFPSFRVIGEIRGLNLMLFEKTKPIFEERKWA